MPEALDTFSLGISATARVKRGMKKKALPNPWTRRESKISSKEMLVLNLVNQRKVRPREAKLEGD